MATITLPTSTQPGNSASKIRSVAAAALAQGQIVYRDSNGKSNLARANALGTASVWGVALQSGTADTEVDIQTEGEVKGLSGLTAGTIYVLSDSVAGGIMPIADANTGDYISIVGVAKSATVLALSINNSGVAI